MMLQCSRRCDKGVSARARGTAALVISKRRKLARPEGGAPSAEGQEH
jgi:hypothetical protein